MQHLRLAVLHLREYRRHLPRPSLMLTDCYAQAIILPGNLIYIGFSIVGVKRTSPPASLGASVNHRFACSVRQLCACGVSDHSYQRYQVQNACSPDMPIHLTRAVSTPAGRSRAACSSPPSRWARSSRAASSNRRPTAVPRPGRPSR